MKGRNGRHERDNNKSEKYLNHFGLVFQGEKMREKPKITEEASFFKKQNQNGLDSSKQIHVMKGKINPLIK